MMRNVLAVCISGSLALSTILALAAFAGAKRAEATIYGTVSCSIPPPASKSGATSASDSVQQCLDRHGKVVIVVEGKSGGVTIDNPDTVRGYEGHRVAVSGYATGESFHVIRMRII